MMRCTKIIIWSILSPIWHFLRDVSICYQPALARVLIENRSISLRRVNTLTKQVFPGALLMFMIFIGSSVCFAFQTENVFIVVFDGLRNNEGFEAGDLYLRFLVDSLAPRGTIYDHFWNTGITVTNAAHSTIATGVRQILRNNAGVATQIRPSEPTVAEYYRKDRDIAQDEVFFFSGKSTIWKYPVSAYPGYGYDYGPSIILTSDADVTTWETARTTINQYHPSLCYVLFAQIDEAGHSGDTTFYINTIRQADSLTYELWKLIQNDPIYQDRTTMIITADHGRDDDHHGGWIYHGCYCHGCRNIPFLAIGPDIKKDTVISLDRDQIDIAPTIGYLLGFTTPFAQGNIMTEMIISGDLPANKILSNPGPGEINVSNSAGHSRSCDIAVDRAGVHVVYSDNSSGNHDIYYTKSTDQGNTWSAPQDIFSNSTIEYTDPVIATFGDSGLYVAVANYFYLANDTTFMWGIRGRRSTNSGTTWESEAFIDTSFGISCRPSICVSGNRIDVASMRYVVLVSNLSRNAGASFEPAQKIVPILGTHPHSPSATFVDTTCYVVWPQISYDNPYHNIWFSHYPWSRDTIITTNTAHSYSYEPSITSDQNGVLHLTYAQLANDQAGNLWQINHKRSVDLGSTWSAGVNIVQGNIGVQPVIKASENGKVFMVWADYTGAQWKISGSYSVDNGLTWLGPYPLTSAQQFSIKPALAINGDSLCIAWQDMRDGNWEIFFKSIAFTEIGETQNQKLQTMNLEITPNPFCKHTEIKYQLINNGSLMADGQIELKIYNAAGQVICNLPASPSTNPLQRQILWNARDDKGNKIGSGVYFCKLTNRDGSITKKLVLLK